jgi:hypothetical protein
LEGCWKTSRRDERLGKKLKKNTGKREETEDFLCINLNKTEIMLEGG